ncbi:metal ABC transporter solute-binding protein, Zn/Mn family [Orrella daihaiensis]|uniref:Zinc ABC transporter substrate-binding protein n=1 Tax=Orrella daihaiensis TaxID=2782176 RepID=A0ABY4AJ73_9BURK|nr:zinc ABC transporter substrate-binding protein [Orrella daihaiensis]UOD50341.1 zinc ABC transporter substrate-binding protein [Orrella daihaiensis]
MRVRLIKFLSSVAACSVVAVMPASALAANSEPVKVVATFSILADMVHQVGGENVIVTSLVGPDEDAHVFDPSPADAKALAQADVVVINGLGFEGWIDRLIKSSGFKGKLVVATEGIKPIEISEAKDDGHDHGKHSHDKHDKHDKHKHADHKHDHHDHGDFDPHAWQDLSNAKIYVKNIRDALLQVAPSAATDINLRADRYVAEIDALNQQIRNRLAEIPAQDRRVIASHGAFEYFAQAYDIKFFSLQGWTTEREPSAADVARLIREIKHDKVRALFVENMADPRLMNRISEETGVRVGGELYSDALSAPGTVADTYLKMFAYNADLIWSTLQQ